MRILLTALFAVSVLSSATADDAMFQIGVKATYDGGTMQVIEVNPNGPGARLQNDQVPQARLEPRDVIEEIDGQPIRSDEDLVRVMNDSLDGYLSLKVLDVRTGQSSVWRTSATPLAATPYRLMRDTLKRAVRTNQIPMTKFVFTELQNNRQIVMSNLHSVLEPVFPDQDAVTADEKYRRLLVGALAVEQYEETSPPLSVFTKETFADCDAELEQTFNELADLENEERKMVLATEAVSRINEILKNVIEDWSEKNGYRYLEEATMPLLVTFQVRSSIPGATVQVMLFAEKVLRLSRQGFPVRPVDQNGQQYLDTVANWTPLTAPDARAYGRYYYRLVYLQDGQFRATPFDENRVIIISQMPANGEIFFQ